MSFLVDFQIKEEIINNNLISNYIDLNVQLQPTCFEFTVDKIYSISGSSTIDFDNSSRKLSNFLELSFQNDCIFLKLGIYKVLFNEIINIPSNIFAIGYSRSSLIRCGNIINTAVWDPGYHGKSECLLTVNNTDGLILKKNARILQLLFYKLDTSVENTYSGIYNN